MLAVVLRKSAAISFSMQFTVSTRCYML